MVFLLSLILILKYYFYKIKKTMAEEAEQDCQYISEQLSNHLKKDTTKAQIVQWLAGIPSI